MVNIYDTEMQFSLLPFSSINDLNLESTLKNLSLYDVQVDVNQPGIIVTRKLEERRRQTTIQSWSETIIKVPDFTISM